MKSNAKAPLYFSAYPLKAIAESSSPSSSPGQTPYLRSVLAGKSKTSSRVRVFPMANPYPKKTVSKQVKPARQVDATGDEWFNHYE
jgi:hypothetical protein